MGRPPCCDKVGIKKGPWTPEEDIVLVSYIQEHGPGNWSAVPTNTGLMRCSKSCRLRWTNYLRPGIKRGNFTPHEEGMIIHLQALLGNKWAAIASYLPQRTDNDIKNYWNTHLKKKLKKFQSSVDPQKATSNENSTMYASSAENISRLMENWTSSSSSSSSLSSSLLDNMTTTSNLDVHGNVFYRNIRQIPGEKNGENGVKSDEMGKNLSFDHGLINSMENVHFVHDQKMKVENDPPLLFLEKWLMDENGSQVEGEMNISPIF